MSNKLNTTQKELEKLQTQQAQIEEGLRALQVEAAQTAELDDLEALETKIAARKRLLTALSSKVTQARREVTKAQKQAAVAAAAKIRIREAAQRDKTIRSLLDLQANLDDLQNIGLELQALGLSRGWQPPGDLVHRVKFTIDHVKGFAPELIP